MSKQHDFNVSIRWTGNRGEGTKTYRGYDRTWDIESEGKQVVHCSNDPMLGGDPSKHNPEDFLIAALSSCHMLWYLHLANQAGISVRAYSDNPVGHGETLPDGSGRFLSATLRPAIEVPKGTDIEKAKSLHRDVHKYCFIARSVNFPIACEPEFTEI